ncbi:MAG: FAD-dependent monooxygenase [Candidatus Binatia bacterium]
MSEPYDVAIVGYGPVGQTLAILLAQRGWRIGVFEKQPSPYPLPRAVHFDHEVARVLQAAGLGEALPRLTEPADVYEWKNAAGETLLRIGSRDAGLSGWPEANMFSQPELERALDARVRALSNVAVHRGAEVVDLEPRGEGVGVIVQCDDRRHEVQARAVVGCDGANSFARRRVGARVTDLGFFFDWLIVDVFPHQRRVWDPINEQICDPERPTTVVSGGPGRRRWEFMRLPGEDVAHLNSEATAWRLLQPWHLHATNAIGGVAGHLDGGIRDVRGKYAQWFRDNHVGVVLQRPDFHIFGTGAAIEDGPRLVRALRSALEGRSEGSIR